MYLSNPSPSSQPSPIEGEGVLPAQLAFTVWRVNDYDLAIQHNEAVNLACEHIGIERTRSDGFFDGTLGKSLVKIIPFGHPLSPLDLDEIRKELEARPDEDRPVTVVCLGKELAAGQWLDDWNRLRKVFNVALSDIPEKKTDFVAGSYEVAAPKGKTTVAVKVIDMLGEEVVETFDV